MKDAVKIVSATVISLVATGMQISNPQVEFKGDTPFARMVDSAYKYLEKEFKSKEKSKKRK